MTEPPVIDGPGRISSIGQDEFSGVPLYRGQLTGQFLVQKWFIIQCKSTEHGT
jgi:hypothetical protein